jgi:hypothetical protein
MSWLAAFLFTVLCRPGTIYEADGSATEIWGENKSTYYYYELEYTPGTYLYVSLEHKDSVWLLIENKVEYLKESPKNEEFEIQN